MSRRSIRLSWVNFIRERKGKMEPKRILAELLAYGVFEERRIMKAFADDRKKAQAELRELKKAAKLQCGGVSEMEQLKEPIACGACGNKIYGAGISKDGDVVHPCCR